MFNPEEFAKNQFILKKVSLEHFQFSPKEKGIMHVGFNVNDAYFMQMGVAVTSILESNPGKKFCFHVFCDGYSEASFEKVKQTADKYGQNIYIYVMDMQPFQAFHLKVARFSRVTYLRSVMPKILKPLTDKFLYMDADMICNGDISQIEKIDLKGYPFAAVSESPQAVKYKTEFLHQKSGTHFNDGMMWIDIAKWEEEKITERVFSYQGADPRRFSGQSQDIMNLVLDGEICFTERRFNQYAGENLPEDTVIYHFLGRDKPWEMIAYPCDKLWRHYLDLSVWDSITDPMPPKKGKYYHNYKRLMQLDRKRGNYLSMLSDLFWYSVLKIVYRITG